ncbi:uncharacterized protein RAG0_04097 [Rhynchosporium agropyri]|uniref:Uncharacterized protein n=1 Tax=Rhynchosporium agropyri TaxID=914238 RepID=A0A1E1K7K3_9HELO|nr:uncharacterized protein RAG0_04097 [Rhynchosporium agropyri]
MTDRTKYSLEGSFDPVYDDLAQMRYILADHYFNWQLSSVANLRDFVLDLLTTIRNAQGLLHQHKDSPAQSCTTKGVIGAIEEDVEAILETAATMDPEFITRCDVAALLRERIAIVLGAMREEVQVKAEPAEIADYGSEEDSSNFSHEGPGQVSEYTFYSPSNFQKPSWDIYRLLSVGHQQAVLTYYWVVRISKQLPTHGDHFPADRK